MDSHVAIWEHCLQTAALSDIGLRRGNNQDSMATVLAGSQEKFEQRGHVFLVADGMGAHAAGELASKLAADLVPLTYYKLVDRSPPDALQAAVRDANSQIHSRGMASEDFRGMGTTVSVLALLPQGALAAHVGDSRVYRLRGTTFEQLTFDHSLVWELRAAGHVPAGDSPSHIPKNIITRSLGPNAEVKIDLEGPFPLEPGDTFLLCSDGLSGQVQDEEMGVVLQALDPKQAVRALVDLANLRGGPDNITVIVARVAGPLEARGQGAATGLAAPAGARRPIHPAVWASMGLFVLGAALLAAMGQATLAVFSLLGAVGSSIVALLQYVERPNSSFDGTLLGKGPHVTCHCPPSSTVVERLARVVRQLRDAAEAAVDWSINWEPFRRHESRAEAARDAARYLEAAREYCLAMSFMMAELRSQHSRHNPEGGGPSNLLEA